MVKSQTRDLQSGHNKSGSNHLSILQYRDKYIQEIWVEALLDAPKEASVGSLGKQCWQLKAKDGRLSFDSVKVPGYQVVAWKKFGRQALLRVPPRKVCYHNIKTNP